MKLLPRFNLSGYLYNIRSNSNSHDPQDFNLEARDDLIQRLHAVPSPRTKQERLEALISNLEQDARPDLRAIILNHIQGRKRYKIRDEDFGLVRLQSKNFNRLGGMRYGSCEGWNETSVPGLEGKIDIYLDSPQAIALTYKNYPIAFIAFELSERSILVRQIQGVNRCDKSSDDTSTVVFENKVLKNCVNEFRELLIKILMKLAKQAGYRKIKIQSFFNRIIFDPERAYCANYLPAYELVAKRLGFKRSLWGFDFVKRI